MLSNAPGNQYYTHSATRSRVLQLLVNPQMLSSQEREGVHICSGYCAWLARRHAEQDSAWWSVLSKACRWSLPPHVHGDAAVDVLQLLDELVELVDHARLARPVALPLAPPSQHTLACTCGRMPPLTDRPQAALRLAADVQVACLHPHS